MFLGRPLGFVQGFALSVIPPVYGYSPNPANAWSTPDFDPTLAQPGQMDLHWFFACAFPFQGAIRSDWCHFLPRYDLPSVTHTLLYAALFGFVSHPYPRGAPNAVFCNLQSITDQHGTIRPFRPEIIPRPIGIVQIYPTCKSDYRKPRRLDHHAQQTFTKPAKQGARQRDRKHPAKHGIHLDKARTQKSGARIKPRNARYGQPF